LLLWFQHHGLNENTIHESWHIVHHELQVSLIEMRLLEMHFQHSSKWLKITNRKARWEIPLTTPTTFKIQHMNSNLGPSECKFEKTLTEAFHPPSLATSTTLLRMEVEQQQGHKMGILLAAPSKFKTPHTNSNLLSTEYNLRKFWCRSIIW
jgi:hypothetical protein